MPLIPIVPIVVVVVAILAIASIMPKSFHGIGPTEVGLVRKRFGPKNISGSAVALNTEAEGLAVVAGLEAQQKAIGREQTAIVNAAKALADGGQRFMPDTLALTIGEGGAAALVPSIIKFLNNQPSPPVRSLAEAAE